MTIRVGFILEPEGNSWLGGKNYFNNLLAAILGNPDRKITPVVFTGTQDGIDFLADLNGLEIIRSPIFERKSLLWLLRKTVARVCGRDIVAEWRLKFSHVGILSHSYLGSRSKMPTIGWIPDFQHRHLPGFFDKKALGERDNYFRQLCAQSVRVIVSSKAAQDDLRDFDPASAERSRVVRFVSLPDDQVEDLAWPSLKSTYSLPDQYLFLPNQFWVHKNHLVVIEALRLLKHQGINYFVIATGHAVDPRNPEHFKNIQAKIKAYGLEDQFKILGVLPRPHIFGLMRYAKAVINPSLFEGWSTTVEEAKALGKTVVLSDLPVHREQAPAQAHFFQASRAEDLAEVLKTVAAKAKDGPKLSYNDLRLSFARQYEEVVLEASKL